MTKKRTPEEKTVLEAIDLVTHHSRTLDHEESRSEIEERVWEAWGNRERGREELALEAFDRMGESEVSPIICSYAAMAANALGDRAKALSIAVLGLAHTDKANRVRRAGLLNLVGLYIWFLTDRRETRVPTLLFEEALRVLPGGANSWSPYVNLMEIKLEKAQEGADLDMAVDEVDELFARLHASWDQMEGEKNAWVKDETYTRYCLSNNGLRRFRSARGGEVFKNRFAALLDQSE